MYKIKLSTLFLIVLLGIRVSNAMELPDVPAPENSHLVAHDFNRLVSLSMFHRHMNEINAHQARGLGQRNPVFPPDRQIGTTQQHFQEIKEHSGPLEFRNQQEALPQEAKPAPKRRIVKLRKKLPGEGDYSIREIHRRYKERKSNP